MACAKGMFSYYVLFSPFTYSFAMLLVLVLAVLVHSCLTLIAGSGPAVSMNLP